MHAAINHFLTVAARWTPRWFNKPKFHIVMHLPDHVRRFGPAILFATEGFESFNAVIRAQSVHSSHHAPSHDIARGFAHLNRTRHLLSGGYGYLQDDNTPLVDARTGALPPRHRPSNWKSVGPGPIALLHPITGRNVIAAYIGAVDEDSRTLGDFSSRINHYLNIDYGRRVVHISYRGSQGKRLDLYSDIQSLAKCHYRCSQVHVSISPQHRHCKPRRVPYRLMGPILSHCAFSKPPKNIYWKDCGDSTGTRTCWITAALCRLCYTGAGADA